MQAKLLITTFLILIFTLLSTSFLPLPALAASGGCDKLKGAFDKYGGQFANTPDSLPQYCTAVGLIRYILNIIFLLIGGGTMIMIIIGGYRYITSAGNQEQADAGKQTVLYAVIGLAVAMMAAALVNIVINLFVNGKAF